MEFGRWAENSSNGSQEPISFGREHKSWKKNCTQSTELEARSQALNNASVMTPSRVNEEYTPSGQKGANKMVEGDTSYHSTHRVDRKRKTQILSCAR